MSASSELADLGETDRLSAAEAADEDDAGSDVRVSDIAETQDISDAPADATGNQTRTVRDRILKTACLYASFVTMGLCTPLYGTTIVHMERLFDSNTATMSWTFTVMSLGHFTGAVACGFVFDRFNRELQLVIANCVEAATIIVAPFFTMLPMFIAMLFIHAATHGFITAGGQSYCVGLWIGHRYKEPLLQAAHACWSLGATVGPFIISPFLVELPQTNVVSNVNRTSTSPSLRAADLTALMSNYCGSTESTNYVLLNDTTLEFVSKSQISVVRYAYVTIGCIVFVTSALYAAAYCHDRIAKHSASTLHQRIPMTRQTTTHKKDGIEVSVRKPAKRQFREKLMTFMFLVLLFMFYHIFAYLERTPISYFSTFAIKFLHWPMKDVSPLMSLFFGTHCAGRFLGVLLSFVLRPQTMLITNLIFTTIAYIILFPVCSLTKLLWASAALSGLGMSTTYATAVLWVAESVAITGRVSSFAVAGGSFGSVIQPQIVGRLFDIPAAGGPMSMVYVLVSAAILHIVLFACMVAFVARCLKNRYPTVQETLVPVPSSPQRDVKH